MSQSGKIDARLAEAPGPAPPGRPGAKTGEETGGGGHRPGRLRPGSAMRAAPMYRILRYFAITGVVAIAMLAVVLASYLRHETNRLMETGEGQNIAFTQAFVNAVWPRFASYVNSVPGLDGDALRARPETAEIHATVAALMRGMPVLKVKIYNLEGLTVYSSAPGQIGEDQSGNAAVVAARAGKVFSRLTHRHRIGAFEREFTHGEPLESYVPIRRGSGPVEAVFEIYSDVTPLLEKTEQAQDNLLVGFALVVGAFFGVLFLIARRADRVLKQQYGDLLANQEDLKTKNRELEHEIAERTAAEQALRESEERFRVVVNHAPTKIHIKDLEGRYLLVNKEAEELFGVSDEDARGRTSAEIFPKERAEAFAAHDRAVIEAGRAIEEEEEWVREDGVHTYLTVKFPIRDASGKTIAVGAIGTDITERKAAEAARERLEAQLRQAQKMEAVGTLAGGIAHDFNNILAGMVGYAHLAINAVPAGSRVRGDLEQILKSIDRAARLVQQILAFSRRSEAESHPVEVRRVVEEALQLLRASIPATIEIHRKIDREAGTVMADATQLQRVVMNLCTNAADAIGRAPGRIEVALAEVELGDADTASVPDLAPGSYAKLSVSDSGTGNICIPTRSA